jgi:hypothetical protein
MLVEAGDGNKPTESAMALLTASALSHNRA